MIKTDCVDNYWLNEQLGKGGESAAFIQKTLKDILVDKGGKFFLFVDSLENLREIDFELSNLISVDMVAGIVCPAVVLEKLLFEMFIVPTNRPCDNLLCMPFYLKDLIVSTVKDILIIKQRYLEIITFHELVYEIAKNNEVQNHLVPEDQMSWLLSAKKTNLPIFTVDLKDTAIANIMTTLMVRGDLGNMPVIFDPPDEGLEMVKYLRSCAEVIDGPSICLNYLEDNLLFERINSHLKFPFVDLDPSQFYAFCRILQNLLTA